VHQESRHCETTAKKNRTAVDCKHHHHPFVIDSSQAEFSQFTHEFKKTYNNFLNNGGQESHKANSRTKKDLVHIMGRGGGSNRKPSMGGVSVD
jgi:hypothetical protein